MAVCKYCRKEFETKDKRVKFCSSKCKRKYRKNKVREAVRRYREKNSDYKTRKKIGEKTTFYFDPLGDIGSDKNKGFKKPLNLSFLQNGFRSQSTRKYCRGAKKQSRSQFTPKNTDYMEKNEKFTDSKIPKVIELFEKGKKTWEIAKELDVKIDFVWECLRRYVKSKIIKEKLE
jgi:hypothetical protein